MITKHLPIGIFDSGIGGLTVANAISKHMPYERLIYFGDTKHLPYGEKSEDLIKEFSKNIYYFLKEKKCKAIIIACNSASSVAYESLKKISTKIPIYNVIDPVIDKINHKYNDKTIGVIGTKSTIKSGVYKKKLFNKNNHVIIKSLSTPLLAPMIEEGFFNQEISRVVLENYLKNPKIKDISALILGCTHYPLIQSEIRKFYSSKIKIFNSAEIVAKYIYNDLTNLNLLNTKCKSTHEFYVSNYTESFEKSASIFFKTKINLKEIKLAI